MRVKEVRLAILVVLAASAAGCATSTFPITPTVTFVDVPPLGQITEASIGATLVEKAQVYVVDGLRLDSAVTLTGGGGRLELDAGEYAAIIRTQSHILYDAVELEMTREHIYGSPILNWAAGFRMREENGELDAFAIGEQGRIMTTYRFEQTVPLTPIKVTAVNEPSFRQELIYNGRIGNTIRVLYREFQNDMARPAFTQDVVYDLAESNIIGFQDVRIEIVDANNTRVRYRVIAGFPDIELILYAPLEYERLPT